MVAAAKAEASAAGVAILRRGGNAVDAAVAAGFAIGVLEPNASGLGGGGFMTLKRAGQSQAVVIDFRGAAPGRATPTMFTEAAGGGPTRPWTSLGGLAVAVPGGVAGLLLALERFGSGRLSRAEVMQPAIDWAERGIPVTPGLARIIGEEAARIRTTPACAALYLPGGAPPAAGAALPNRDLAATLGAIAAGGPDVFYRGELAGRIAAAVQAAGGLLTVEDLAAYRPRLRAPLSGTYRGWTVLSAPPASSGGVHLVQMLNLLEGCDLAALGAGSAAALHLWAEVHKLVFADRAAYLADPDFLEVPVAGLTAKAYARERAALIDPGRSQPAAAPGDPCRHRSGSTTHLSVMDREGNLVALTQTINDFFGCGVAVPGTGILLNDDMDDFDPEPGRPNSVAAGKRPLSCMTPTLVLDPEGRPAMTLGTPGGPRIFGTVAQILVNLIDHGMTLDDAIDAPRMFQGATGDLELEGRIPEAVRAELRRLGHGIAVHEDRDMYFGGAQAVVLDATTGQLVGSADRRRDGQAVGY
jgi:gamma-glutamyltranspeptidase/glutathione hydrolase